MYWKIEGKLRPNHGGRSVREIFSGARHWRMRFRACLGGKAGSALAKRRGRDRRRAWFLATRLELDGAMRGAGGAAALAFTIQRQPQSLPVGFGPLPPRRDLAIILAGAKRSGRQPNVGLGLDEGWALVPCRPPGAVCSCAESLAGPLLCTSMPRWPRCSACAAKHCLRRATCVSQRCRYSGTVGRRRGRRTCPGGLPRLVCVGLRRQGGRVLLGP
jgi:hypothetical protein